MADEAHSEGGGLVFHPMDQFIVKPLFGGDAIHWYTPTNVTLWMGLAVLAIFALLVLGTSKRAIVPGRTQSIAEMAYGFIYKMVEDICGKEGLKYFPYIMTLFMFIVVANFLGLLPMAFTTTSHIAVTAVMAMAVFLTVTILGFVLHGASFLSIFWISAAPLALRPILALIEVISYFVRPISHSIRLAGNMMAGHAVIKVFAGFAAIAAIAPLSIIAITAIYLSIVAADALFIVLAMGMKPSPSGETFRFFCLRGRLALSKAVGPPPLGVRTFHWSGP